MPLVDEEDMQEHANEQVLSVEKVFRDTATDVLSQGDIPNFSDKQDFKNGEVQFRPIILRAVDHASFDEQSSVLTACVSAVDRLTVQPARAHSSIAVVGPPGCGKSHILSVIYTYCLSKGLRTMLVAITSERARKMGGEHLHMLFCIPVQQGYIYTVHSVASKAILSLARNPIRLAILQRLRIILFEEMSLLSA